MENNHFSKIRAFIKGIEQNNEELNNYLLKMPVTTRTQQLKDIFYDFKTNNTILKKDTITKDNLQHYEGIREVISVESVVIDLISNIKDNPSKKVIILREFLNNVSDISESDKTVILQSLKNEKEENLAEKVLSLLRIFKLDNR